MKKFTLVLMVGMFSLLLAACGGSQARTTIDVVMTDFIYTPDAFTIPAGEEITITAKNEGAVVHNFVIMKYGTDIGDGFGAEDEESERLLSPRLEFPALFVGRITNPPPALASSISGNAGCHIVSAGYPAPQRTRLQN